MKPIDKKDLPEVSGGYSPDGECFPPLPFPDYPTNPVGPFPTPMPDPIDPEPFAPAT